MFLYNIKGGPCLLSQFYVKQKTRPLQSVIRGPLVIFPLFKEWFSYLLDSASLYIFLIAFWLDIWKIIHFTWYFNEETSSLDIEKLLTVVIYIIDREMGDHFGNWLFPKPLVVLIMIILKKFMRWYFLRPIAQSAYFLTIVLGLYIIYAVLDIITDTFIWILVVALVSTMQKVMHGTFQMELMKQ